MVRSLIITIIALPLALIPGSGFGAGNLNGASFSPDMGVAREARSGSCTDSQSIFTGLTRGFPDENGECEKMAQVDRPGRGASKDCAGETSGTPALAAISGIEWILEEMDGQPLQPGSKAPTFKVSGGSVAGFAGCNRYSGALNESAPGSISLGPLAATKMACVGPQMSLEDRFLRDLRRVTSYTMLKGRLILVWKEGGESGSLVFRR